MRSNLRTLVALGNFMVICSIAGLSRPGRSPALRHPGGHQPVLRFWLW